MKKIFFLSNGYGEDTIAANIIKYLRNKDKNLEFLALPLVGKGLPYHELGIKTIGTGTIMPSGGLIPENHFKNIIRDLRGGLLKLTYEQIRLIKKISKEAEIIILVGDAYPVILGWLFARNAKSIFIGTAKSNYFCPYSKLEKWLFKKYCYKVFARDEYTASDLKFYGINASWLGNAMMDSLNITGQNFGAEQDQTFIGILPGSREQTYKDFPVILKTAEKLFQKIKNPFLIMALAPSVSYEKVCSIAREEWWLPQLLDTETRERLGLIGRLRHDSGIVYLTQTHFGDVINNAKIVIGQAGTGNEQAAGLGKPVVSFAEDPQSPGWYRFRQKGLLGEALEIAERDSFKIAEKVLSILQDKEKYESMSRAGTERMAPPGAVSKIAEFVYGVIGVEA